MKEKYYYILATIMICIFASVSHYHNNINGQSLVPKLIVIIIAMTILYIIKKIIKFIKERKWQIQL